MLLRLEQKFFSQRSVLSPFLGQVQLSIDQATEAGFGIGDGDVVDAVFDFSAIAVVLSLYAACMISALGRSRFINSTNGFWVRMLGGDQPLASIPKPWMVPNNV
jgi:hypothetical protein